MATVAGPTRSSTTIRVEQALRGQRLDVGSRLFELTLLSSLLLALLVLVALLVDVALSGAVVFQERGLSFLTSDLSRFVPRTGIAQGIQGSLLIALLTALFAFPIGIGGAIYLEEYAKDTRLTRFIRVNIRNLAGVPSIVYGILGLAIFVNLVFNRQTTLLAGGMTMAVLVLPIVIITASEALRAVPSSIREAAFGVGATRSQVVRSHVLPYAAPGILTGTVLSLARAIGETAPLLLVGAATGFFTAPGGFLEQFTGKYAALPVTIFAWARDPNPLYRDQLVPAAIIVLLVIVFLVNAAAIILRNRYERKW